MTHEGPRSYLYAFGSDALDRQVLVESPLVQAAAEWLLRETVGSNTPHDDTTREKKLFHDDTTIALHNRAFLEWALPQAAEKGLSPKRGKKNNQPLKMTQFESIRKGVLFTRRDLKENHWDSQLRARGEFGPGQTHYAKARLLDIIERQVEATGGIIGPSEHLAPVPFVPTCSSFLRDKFNFSRRDLEQAIKVGWDGNGLAYWERGPVSDRCQTSVMPDAQSMSQCV